VVHRRVGCLGLRRRHEYVLYILTSFDSRSEISRTEYRIPVSVYFSFPAVKIDLEKVRIACAPRSSAGQVSGLLPYPKPRNMREYFVSICVDCTARNKTIDVAGLMKIGIALRPVNFCMEMLRNVV